MTATPASRPPAPARTTAAADPKRPSSVVRPVLRRDHPLLWRTDDCIQVGDDPRWVLVTGVDRDLVRWAVSLDGLRTTAQAIAAAEASGVGADRAGRLLSALESAGALDDATVVPDSLRTATPELRTALAPDLAAAAHVHGGPHAAAAAIDRRAAARVRVLGSGRVAHAIVAALRTAAVPVLAVPEPRADDSGAGTSQLDVIADAPHPDVPEDHGAMTADRPHLPVSVRGRLARVGPLVVPGVTSCLRCADLHRTDRDPAWPRLAVQLAHYRPPLPPVDATLAVAAGSLAALRVLAWIEAGAVSPGEGEGGDGGGRAAQVHATERAARPGAAEATDQPDRSGHPATGEAVEVELPGGVPRTVRFPPHPLCGCLWRQVA